ncbi:MAG: hypothetical protein QG578_1179 [Thermodesulfobacteriota bacterium]|nr:hypothetical protein [Thermodesulfobacteriota bacterium]
MKRFFIIILLLAISYAVTARSTAKELNIPHLDRAVTLVKELQPENTSYKHKNGYVKWKEEDGADDNESHTDCSGFLTALFEKAYSLTPDHFERWLGKRRPLAKNYHEAIVNRNGFTRIESIAEIEPGDIIAVRYPPGTRNTGHVLIVAETPRERKASRPEIKGTGQWEITVIDSSESGHGKTDTRYMKGGIFCAGAGRGILRVYTDLKGRFAGYTWSTFGNSEYYDQTVRPLVIGRPDLSVKTIN